MRISFGIIFIALSLGSFAQTYAAKESGAKSPEPQETLAICGVELHLGMPQDVVLGQLSRAGCKPSAVQGSEGNWGITRQKMNGEYTALGLVAFHGGILTFIDRGWEASEDSTAAIGEALYGVLSNLYRQGRETCSLQTENRQSPSGEIKDITLTCRPGRSSVVVRLLRYEGRESAGVSEILRAD